jgi:hypothetical protein
MNRDDPILVANRLLDEQILDSEGRSSASATATTRRDGW